MSKQLVFVYGSLRRGETGAMSHRFPDSRFLAEATVSGRLYDLGAYPGLLLGESGSQVKGEVYEIDDEALKQLDDFEAASNYLRRQVEVALGADLATAWTYEPNPECYSFEELIPSGDWIEHAKTKANLGQ